VVDGQKFGLPGEAVMGKGASEQSQPGRHAARARDRHRVENSIKGKLIFTCCLSGETGKHDAIQSVVEARACAPTWR